MDGLGHGGLLLVKHGYVCQKLILGQHNGASLLDSQLQHLPDSEVYATTPILPVIFAVVP